MRVLKKVIKDISKAYYSTRSKKIFKEDDDFQNVSKNQSLDDQKDLKKKLSKFQKTQFKNSIIEAITSCPISENDIILITGSLYLAGEVLNLN